MSVESLMDEGKKLLAAIGYKTMLEAFSKISELPDGVLELGEKGEWSYSIHKVKQGLYLRHMPSGFEFPKCPIGGMIKSTIFLKVVCSSDQLIFKL